MNSVYISTVVILAVIAGSVYADIDGGLLSTSRIASKMCLGNHNDTIAEAFYACYDVAPGKELFAKCQEKVFGVILNTEENITRVCYRLYKFPLYAICLKNEFQAAELDLKSTLALVNPCEAEVLGIN